MSVYRHYAVGVFGHHFAVWVHAESPYHIVVFIGFIHDLAFIYFVCYVFEDFGRKFHPHSYIDAVFCLLYTETVAYRAYPRGARSSRGKNKESAYVFFPVRRFHVKFTVVEFLNLIHGSVKFHLYIAVADCIIHFFKYAHIPVSSKMAYFCPEKMKIMLKGRGLQLLISLIKSGFFASHGAQDFVHVFHQAHSVVFSQIFVKISSELGSYIILAVR